MWRAVVVAALVLMGADSASADVFVPDDPPAQQAECVAAAGDVIVTTRPDGRGGSTVELSEAGGPWRAVALDEDACPHAAAASDGTAVVGMGAHVLVRRPGAAFGPPVRLARRFLVRDLAAAPNGWAAVVGDRGSELVAIVLAPDGRSRTMVLDRLRTTRRRYEQVISPAIGIAANGAPTVGWSRWDTLHDRYTLRTAGPDGRPRTLAAGSVFDLSYGGQVDVAVAPSGRTLLAWADGRGIRAALDGAAAELVTPQRSAGSPTVAIADDGSAVLAYAAAVGRVLVSDRAAGGPWSAPHELTPGDEEPAWEGEGFEPREAELASALGSDGRAVIAWEAAGARLGQLHAATGQIGGTWSRSTPVSTITRRLSSASLSLGTDGGPRLTWLEAPGLHSLGRLRGARLAAGAVMDVTAPVVTTTLPVRTRRTRTGRIDFAIPVRCSEACDVRLRLMDGMLGVEWAAVVRELPAEQTTTIRLRTPRYLAREMLASRDWRRPRLVVLVSDRAGNVARTSSRVRYRIVDRPLLGYRVGPDHDFAMFKRAGDRAVGRLVNALITGLAAGEIDSFGELLRRYRRGIRAIERRHDEVFDTAVGDEIFEALEVPLGRKGYDAEDLLGSV